MGNVKVAQQGEAWLVGDPGEPMESVRQNRVALALWLAEHEVTADDLDFDGDDVLERAFHDWYRGGDD